jgi:hypothetical protein
MWRRKYFAAPGGPRCITVPLGLAKWNLGWNAPSRTATGKGDGSERTENGASRGGGRAGRERMTTPGLRRHGPSSTHREGTGAKS